MIRDNLGIQSYDVTVSLRIPKNFTYPKIEKQTSLWVAIFKQLRDSETDPDMIRTYIAYWKLFKIANSKATIKSVTRAENGELVFTFAFKNFSQCHFFIRQITRFIEKDKPV